VSEVPFYGEKIKTTSSKKLDNVIKNFPKYKGKSIVMEATVEKVCVKKGCWMTLKGSDKTFRVTFKNYGFFVPISLVGKKVLVKGEVQKKVIPIKDAKHYLEDAGASKEKIAAIKGPVTEYSIIAEGVQSL
jgi:hypothetical protein